MSDQKSVRRLAFLGLGLMGKPMASRLFAAGYHLTVRLDGLTLFEEHLE